MFPLVAAIVVLAGTACAPDSWAPFRDLRVVSANGRHYVVICERETPKVLGVDFEFCDRRRGAAALEAAAGKGIDRDEADAVVATGYVPQLPYAVRVLDDGSGFVLFDQYYRLGHGAAVTGVDRSGRILVRKSLVEIFGGEPTGSTHTVSSIHWSRGYWVDEQRRSVVVVSRGDEVREVSLLDGEVKTPTDVEFADWMRRGAPENRCLILEVAMRRAQRRAFRAVAAQLAADPEEPLSVRLRATVLLERDGAPGDHAALLLATLRSQTERESVRAYAAEHLPEVVGMAAMPLLRAARRASRGDVWRACERGFVKLGEAAVPILCEMAVEEGAAANLRSGAASCLGEIGSVDAVPTLVRILATADESTANAAANALIAIDPPNLAACFIDLLADGSKDDGRLAMYFERHPTPAAAAALEKALARHPPDSIEHRWLKNALAKSRSRC